MAPTWKSLFEIRRYVFTRFFYNTEWQTSAAHRARCEIGHSTYFDAWFGSVDVLCALPKVWREIQEEQVESYSLSPEGVACILRLPIPTH